MEDERASKRARIEPDLDVAPFPGDIAMEVACRVHCAEDVRAMAYTCRTWHTSLTEIWAKKIWSTLAQKHFPGCKKKSYAKCLRLLASRMDEIITFFFPDRWVGQEQGKMMLTEPGANPRRMGKETKFVLPTSDMDNEDSAWWGDYPPEWDRGCWPEKRATKRVELFRRFLSAVTPLGQLQIFTYNEDCNRKESNGLYMEWSIVHKGDAHCWIYTSRDEPSSQHSSDEQESEDESNSQSVSS